MPTPWYAALFIISSVSEALSVANHYKDIKSINKIKIVKHKSTTRIFANDSHYQTSARHNIGYAKILDGKTII